LEKLVSYLIKVFPESLNLKTPDGLTPLHLCFYLRRLPLAKILIEAGADVNAKDNNGANLIHVLLSSSIFRRKYGNEQSRVDHYSIAPFIELLGEEKCHELLLQRNRSNTWDGGARTPFHSWVLTVGSAHSSCTDHCCAKETFELLLKYSKVDALSMIDGSGDTPVHTVVHKSHTNFFKRMLELDPGCLMRENAVGRTPMELARDLFLNSKVSDPPALNTPKNRHRNIPHDRKNLIDRQECTFIVKKEPTGVELIWQICQGHTANHTLKRRLVSLNEANEIAKRLCSQQFRLISQEDTPSDGTVGATFGRKDEVREWLPRFDSAPIGVPLKCPGAEHDP
jgi:ankyrin repeat protein